MDCMQEVVGHVVVVIYLAALHKKQKVRTLS
jgi:hypothetical protein